MNQISTLSLALVIGLAAGIYFTGGINKNSSTFQDEAPQTEAAAAIDEQANPFKASPDPISGRIGPVIQEQAKPNPDSERKPGQPLPYFGELPSLALINVRDVVLDEISAGLDKPWAMEFLSDSELLVTESGGSMKRVNLEDRSATAVAGMPAIPSGKGQIGLMDIALHPDFDDNQMVYFSHASQAEGGEERYATAVSRARLTAAGLENVEQIFLAAPFTDKFSNFGGALAFDAAGLLYIATGDRGESSRSQDLNVLNGKIIRLTDDGHPAPGNPFTSDEAVDNRIYAYGVRNPQGLVYDAVSDKLYEAEHGPMGGDEINIIHPGANYGWDMISYGMKYSNTRSGVGARFKGMEQPLFYFLPSLGISPLEIYRGPMFPEWDGHLLVGALKAQHVNMLDVLDQRVLSEKRILGEMRGRVRDIKVADDGSIYFLLQTGGRLLRLHREPGNPALEQPRERRGKDLYNLICASCHSSGMAGVPQLVQSDAWQARLEQGKKRLYRNTLQGIGDMPPRGLCENCADEEIEAAVDYMLKNVRREARKLGAREQLPEGRQ